MGKNLNNIKWEKVPCHICNAAETEPVLLKGEPLVDGQFGFAVHPVICRTCGLVYLSPRWSKEIYSVFYQTYYDMFYRLEIKPDYGVSSVVENMKTIWSRIKGHVDPGKTEKILDIGCAYGFGLRYLKSQMPNVSIYGIESSPEGCESLQSSEVGGKLITNDFDLDWENEYREQMDIIVVRHVFEHVLDPIKTLTKLRSALKPDGIIYFAVPDMINVRTKLRDYENWWEYIFRPVHTYYYSRDTFIKTLEIAKLYPLVIKEEQEEIWCLTKKFSNSEFIFKNAYSHQQDVLNRLLPQK